MLPRNHWSVLRFVASALTAMLIGNVASAATIEFLDGKKIECRVLSKDATTVTVEVEANGSTKQQSFPLAEIHTVTIGDKHYVINERPNKPTAPAKKTSPDSAPASPTKNAAGKELRSRPEIDKLIADQGRTPPDWYEETALNYPKTLDLSWPAKPPGGWNAQANVGQYIWDVINPNPNRWREGTKFVHHLLIVNKDSPETRTRVMNELGRMYFSLHEDYARAAFWYRQAGCEKNMNFPNSTIHLAECYYRLGNKQMAQDILKKSPVPFGAIKLHAEIGDLTSALRIADQYVKGGNPEIALLAAGDACRLFGKHPQAISYYQKVLALTPAGNSKGRTERSQKRAQANLDAIRLYELSDPRKVPDGSYQADSLGYEGPVAVQVTVASGRIEKVAVTQHKEKQFYSAISDTSAKIIAKQGVKGVDATSGATITSEAIINATAKALANAAK